MDRAWKTFLEEVLPAVMEGMWTSAGGCWGEDILNRKKARQMKRGGMRTQTPVKWG